MAAASCLLTEDQFLCSICLDVFTDPVSISCGHNFCKSCITTYWDTNVQCLCPMCKRIYNTRPELQVNTFISEMAAQFRQSAQHKSRQRRRKKTKLTKAESEIQQMIQKRRLKIEEIQQSVDLSNEAADRELAEGDQVFTALKETVERSQAEFIKTIKEKQRTTEKQAEDFITELEQEITDLKKRSSEMEQLSSAKDQLHLLQTFKHLFQYKDWTEVRVCPPSYEGTVLRAVKQLEEKLWKPIQRQYEAELQRVKQFAVYVLLNPVIIINNLLLETSQCKCAFSLKSFTSGRFYFEVHVKNSPWTLGVARIPDTQRQIMLRPSNNYWTVCANPQGEHYAATDPPVRLSLRSQLALVGVFVDYEEGLVSFHDVDAADLIYCFTGCSFAGSIHPFFSSCANNGVRGSWWWRKELCLH